jgi:hypothetical protein
MLTGSWVLDAFVISNLATFALTVFVFAVQEARRAN